MSKGQVKPVQKSTSTRAVKKLFRVYLDLGGKMKTRSIGGNWYTLIIRDDFSRWTRVFFLKHKSDAAVGFEKFLADYRTKGVPCEVCIARTDGGGEFQGQFAELCRRHGIKEEFTPPHTPKYNGVAERALGLITDAALASRIQATQLFPDAPNHPGLWAEAISCACHQLNCTATKSNEGDKSAYEMFHDSPPPVGSTYPFLKPAVFKSRRKAKSQPKGEKGWYLGPAHNHPRECLSMTSPIGQKPSDVEAVPMTYKDVMCSKYKVFWEAAMKKEIDGHDKTGTFTKVKELYEGQKATGSKWVLSWKTNDKGLIVDFKAPSIKTVIAVASEKGKKLAHWDVKQAYIHAKLKDELYLRFPGGCGSMSGKVVNVESALYGLKQSGREWGFEAADALIEDGYEQYRVDPCVFRKVVDGEVVGLIVIYVDDILVAADEGGREELFASLNKKSPVKDLGECTLYDGCAIAMDVENGITKLSQTAYIESMLKRFDVTTTAFTPAATDADLGPKRDDEPAVDKPVREAIGCLMWTKLTRPDIALPLNKLQKIAHSPTGMIWNALVRIMSYLNFTKDFGITYVRGLGLDLSVFVYASYADNEVDRRSTTGLAGVKEAVFVRGVLPFHFIRELFKSGKITAEYVPTGEQHADMLTKVLGREKLEYHRKALMNLPM
ncbi:unnamed protein product [Ectocarpus sp. CCAP 1310/34]|nr:unnamed protein product [Ectocarpus sp. CCAP 1310/34]